jgi:hypothetical protein
MVAFSTHGTPTSILATMNGCKVPMIHDTLSDIHQLTESGDVNVVEEPFRFCLRVVDQQDASIKTMAAVPQER